MSQPLKLEVLDRASAIDTLSSELMELAGRALEPNVFNEALMFIPALQLIDQSVALQVVCVREPNGRLHGVIPLVLEPLRSGFPALVLRNWTHRYCFLGTPILDAQAASRVLDMLADWIASGAAPAGGLEWVKVSWDGPFGQLLRHKFCDSRAWLVSVARLQRAVLRRGQHHKLPMSGRHAKELRRLERRLAELGTVAYSVMKPSEDWRVWFEDFLSVEASGWKGAGQTAINMRPDDREYFRRVWQQAHAGGQLQVMRLAVGGQPIAMKLNLRARGAAYSLKIGYDEQYAQYSPGVLLELFNIKTFEMEPDAVLSMDSCAAANHPMIDRLWSDRREIATVTLARRGLRLRTAVLMQIAKRRLQQIMPARVPHREP